MSELELQLCLETSILKNVRYIASPNCDERPEDTLIDLLVIHNISLPPGEFGGGHIDSLFCNQLQTDFHPYFSQIANMKVSSHILIDRNGVITQYVPFNKRAWHAGISFFEDRTSCNDFSIGIELEGTDEVPYKAVQYDTLAKLIHILQKTYMGITQDRIVGHSTIAPGRKTDPGPVFDWVLLTKLLNTPNLRA